MATKIYITSKFDKFSLSLIPSVQIWNIHVCRCLCQLSSTRETFNDDELDAQSRNLTSHVKEKDLFGQSIQ